MGAEPVSLEQILDLEKTGAESAVLVPVPEAERAIRRHRARLDAAAARGVPAHVTVLYPFVPPSEITVGTLTALAGAVASVGAFECEFPATAWFGQDVMWLAPRPDAPFRALTRAVCAAFPGYPPYGGGYDDVIPHLTVGDRTADGAGDRTADGAGDRTAGGVADLRAAEAEVRAALPVTARISRVWLMAGGTAPDSWRIVAEFPLGARDEPRR